MKKGKGWHNESRRHSMASRGIKTRERIPKGLLIHPSARNLKMNPDVYKLRRKAIDVISDAKKLVPNLPRINVRVTESNSTKLGSALMQGNAYVIWIPEPTFGKLSKNDLKYVVYHEILHTIYGIPHRNKGIMTPCIQYGHSSKDIDKMFLDEIKKVKSKKRLGDFNEKRQRMA